MIAYPRNIVTAFERFEENISENHYCSDRLKKPPTPEEMSARICRFQLMSLIGRSPPPKYRQLPSFERPQATP